MTIAERIWRRIRHPFSWLERLYETPDPWEMASAREQYRFRETNALLEKAVGHVGSLVEFGSGEGHQTEYLLRIADAVTGVEVSSIAVARARERVPQADFVVGDFAGDYGHFDVATAFEVLNYLPHTEIPGALRNLERQAKTVAVSHWAYAGQPNWFDAYLPAHAETSVISLPNSTLVWNMAWWESPTVKVP